MRMKSVRRLMPLVAVLALTAPSLAQEGHPLKGTWYGDFGTGTERHDLTVAMDWEDNQVTGFVHPGPNAIRLKSAALDVTPGVPAPEGQNSITGTPPEFRVRFEVDVPNSAGGTDSFLFEGMIRNPVAGNRSIVGTWTCGDARGNFQIRRL